MPKFITAPPGTNPMEMPELIKKKQMSTKAKLIMVGLMLVGLACLCSGGAYFLTKKPKPVEANIPTATMLLATETSLPAGKTVTITATGTNTLTLTVTPTQYPPTATRLSATATPMPTQTPRVVNVVITKIVGHEVIKTLIITQIITATPGATQTPWIITNTPEPTQTPWIVYVEVTPTETPTITPTMEPTLTETVTPTIQELEISPTETAQIPYP